MAALDPAVAATRLAVRRCLTDLPSGALILAAVSGGPDSTALAAALAFVGPRLGMRAAAVTVDHGLQRDSGEQAASVVAQCAALGLQPVESVQVDVGRAGGPEAAARDARYAALEEMSLRLGAEAVLLGHTLDDQAETVLLGLARGSGARSLAGMRPVAGRYRRPLLGLRRAQTGAACAAQGLSVWHDPHNDDRRHARVRVRGDALPALEAALGPGVAEALARTAALLADDADALDGWADRVTDPADVAALAALPRGVRTRALRRAAIAAGAPAGSLTADHIAALDALVCDWHGQGTVSLPGRRFAWRRCGRLILDDHGHPGDGNPGAASAPRHRVGGDRRGPDQGEAGRGREADRR